MCEGVTCGRSDMLTAFYYSYSWPCPHPHTHT